MGVLFNINHQTGDLSQYDSTVTDGGDLSVTAAANMSGTNSYGLQCLIDVGNDAMYGQMNQTDPGGGKLRLRSYVNPNGLTMGEGEAFSILTLNTTEAGVSYLAYVNFLYTVATGYRVRIAAREDDNTYFETVAINITDDVHYIEAYIQQAATNVSSDGSIAWWIDGIAQTEVTGKDNFDAFANISNLQFGTPAFLDAGTSGTFYLDEFLANDDGSEIGAVTTPSGTLFNIDHQTGDLSQYDSTATDGGDLSVTNPAGLAGTNFGLNCFVDTTDAMYGQVDQADTGTGVLRFRFYVNPNTLTMADNDEFTLLQFFGTTSDFIVLVQLGYTLANGYNLRTTSRNDANQNVINFTENITNSVHFIELDMQQAATDVSSNGSVELFIDGVSKASGTSIDNYDIFADMQTFRLGAAFGLDAGTSGTFYLDEFLANDDGSEIGRRVSPFAEGKGGKLVSAGMTDYGLVNPQGLASF